MAGLNQELSIWITEKELGSVRSLKLPGRSVQFRVPKEIEDNVTLRFKGYGNSRNGETGDVMLLIRVDRGEDVQANL